VRDPALSPDGTRVAFASNRSGAFDVYTMRVDGTNLVRVTDHPADDTGPTWSPDGTRLAFSSTRDDPLGDIYLVAASGGVPLRLTTSTGADVDPSWSVTDRIAFTTERFGTSEVVTVGPSGGPVSRPAPAGWRTAAPAWSPDGARLAFITRHADPAGDVYVVPATGGAPTVVRATPDTAETDPTWWRPAGSAAPEVVFTELTEAAPASTDIWSAELFGAGRRDHTNRPGLDESGPAFSPDGGRLAYAERTANGDARIVVTDADGRNPRPVTPLGAANISAADPTWSPDGTMIAYSEVERDAEGFDIAATVHFVRVSDGAPLGTVPMAPGLPGFGDTKPAWSPTDVTKLAVSRDTDAEGRNIWILTLAVTPAAVTVTAHDQLTGPENDDGSCRGYFAGDAPAWSPDGRSIAYTAVPGEDYFRLCVIDADGTNPREPIAPPIAGQVPYPASVTDPAWSPDGTVIAFAARSRGNVDPAPPPAIWVVAATGGTAHRTLATPGGARQPTFVPTARGTVTLDLSVAPQPGYVGGDNLLVTYAVKNGTSRPVTASWLATELPTALLPLVTVAPVCAPTVAACGFGTIPAGGTATVAVTLKPADAVNGFARGRLSYLTAEGQPGLVERQAPVVVLRPTLTVNPGIGPPGFVTLAEGTGFPPGATVTLAWRPGISENLIVTVDGAGRFRTQVLVFYKDQLGPRRLVAVRRTGTAFGQVGADFLVVPGSLQPPKFAGRR
jgi:Tol biopolymer transport system component